MIAKMPMTSSPETRRDCIAQVPLRVTSTGILACPKILVISAKKLFRFVSLEVNCPSVLVRRGFSPSADCRAANPRMAARRVFETAVRFFFRELALLWFLYQYPCQVSQKID